MTLSSSINIMIRSSPACSREKKIAQYAKMLYIVYKRKHKDTSIILALKMAEPVKLQN
jgi:hypothetical protein